MSQLIGKKGNNLNPGYVFAPYIMVDNISEVLDSNFSPKKIISSRYSTPIVNPKIDKIKKILEKIEDSNLTSS
jgi:hypothetical protein